MSNEARDERRYLCVRGHHVVASRSEPDLCPVPLGRTGVCGAPMLRYEEQDTVDRIESERDALVVRVRELEAVLGELGYYAEGVAELVAALAPMSAHLLFRAVQDARAALAASVPTEPSGEAPDEQ